MQKMVFARREHGLFRASDDDSELIVDLMAVLVDKREGGSHALPHLLT